MEVVKLAPAFKDYIWGGTKFKSWGKQSSLDKIAECWELSFHQDGPCFIASGEDKGKLLKDVVSPYDLGKNVTKFPFFPVLIKLIDAKENLSVQVHPSDEYALVKESSYGKTEMWYVLEAEEGAGLYVGFKKNENREDVEKALKEGSLLDKLNFFKVKPGDFYFIESGTIHAIGKGVTLIEIQQNSNLTYRLYDYDRVGSDGKKRPLHIQKALEVINYDEYYQVGMVGNLLARTKYFSSFLGKSDNIPLEAPTSSFISFTLIEGNGKVNGMEATRGDTFFIPAGKKANLVGDFKFIYTLVG